MRQDSRLFVMALAALSLGLAAWLNAGHHGCALCGCRQPCEKVCRLVHEEKKVTITCWGAKCEDFCNPGPSCRDCKHCEEVCEECDCNPETPSTGPKKFVWYDWIPGCTKGIYTKKKLMKKTVSKTIPSYKWVVEDLCPRCVEKCAQADAPPPGSEIPPAPLAGAKLVYGKVE